MNLLAGLFDAYPLIAGLFNAYLKASSTKMIAGLFDASSLLEIETYKPSSVARLLAGLDNLSKATGNPFSFTNYFVYSFSSVLLKPNGLMEPM